MSDKIDELINQLDKELTTSKYEEIAYSLRSLADQIISKEREISEILSDAKNAFKQLEEGQPGITWQYKISYGSHIDIWYDEGKGPIPSMGHYKDIGIWRSKPLDLRD